MVRPATVADARAVAEVHVRALWRAYSDFVDAALLAQRTVEERAERWREALEGGDVTMLVWDQSGVVAGFAAVGPSRDGDAPDAGEVYAMYVDPPAQGAGVGTALLARAERALASGGHTAALLWVFEANGQGRAFYEARGWVADSEIASQAPGDWAPKLRYRKALGP